MFHPLAPGLAAPKDHWGPTRMCSTPPPGKESIQRACHTMISKAIEAGVFSIRCTGLVYHHLLAPQSSSKSVPRSDARQQCQRFLDTPHLFSVQRSPYSTRSQLATRTGDCQCATCFNVQQDWGDFTARLRLWPGELSTQTPHAYV